MTDSRRILFDLRPVRIPISGVARYCIHLAMALTSLEKGFDLRALYYGDNSNNEALRRNELLPFPSASTLPRKLLMIGLEFFPILSPLWVRGSFDLVHETYFANAYRCGSQKKVVTIHDIIPVERPEFVNARNRYFSRRNLRRQCAEADHIISVSEYTKQRVIEHSHVDADRITVIPCGVNPILEPPVESYLQEQGLKGTRYLLFVGNIEPRKNIGLAVEALKCLGPSYDDVQFVVAGRKQYFADSILDRCNSLLGKRFHYLGSITDTEKWTLLRSASALVFPSLYEGFGIPIIESYQAGCPTLMADNSSLTELSVDEHQLFDGKSVSSLVGRLADVLDRASWVGKSVELATARVPMYSWESVARRTAEVYTKVLGR